MCLTASSVLNTAQLFKIHTQKPRMAEGMETLVSYIVLLFLFFLKVLH